MTTTIDTNIIINNRTENKVHFCVMMILNKVHRSSKKFLLRAQTKRTRAAIENI
jgi:hypothetical protein